jgi:hypothetical protein
MSELDDPLADAPVTGSVETTEPTDQVNGTPLEPVPTLTVPAANQNLTNARLELRCAYDLQRLYRGRVQQALAQWMRATVRTPTQEEVTRAYLAGEVEQRRLRAEGKLPSSSPQEQRRLGSAIDRFAYYTKSHGRSAGGGRAFARPLVEGQRVFGPAFHGRDLPPKE